MNVPQAKTEVRDPRAVPVVTTEAKDLRVVSIVTTEAKDPRADSTVTTEVKDLRAVPVVKQKARDLRAVLTKTEIRADSTRTEMTEAAEEKITVSLRNLRVAVCLAAILP